MACACRGSGRAGGKSSRGGLITGYQYTSPGGVVTKFMTFVEAKVELRRNGGGTIIQLTS